METLSALAGSTLVSTSQTATSVSSTAADTIEEEKLNFLNLLLTQLENQNPLDPMDTDEYTAQLVSYSQLEQQMEMNESLSNISTQLTQNSLTTNMSYIGQTVEINTNVSAVQDSEAQWAYTIEGTASDVYLTVTDSNDSVLWEGSGGISTGVNDVTLNVSDLGIPEGELLYLSVNAEDSKGNKLNTGTSSFVTVDGVQSDGSSVYLTSGGLSYTLDDVLKISS